MAVDSFKGKEGNLESPATDGFIVSPHDSNELSVIPRALWIGTGGNITVIMQGSTVPLLIKNIPDGYLLPIRVKVIKSTGTTASDIIGFF